MAPVLPPPLGIFGGTFDPIHRGHLRAAAAACAELELARLFLVPNADPPHRPGPRAAAGHRLAMARIAVRGLPQAVVDGRELARPGRSYSVDTVASFRAEVGDTPLCFLLGMDSFLALPQWRRWRELPQLAHLAVLARPGAPKPPPGQWWENMQCNSPAELRKASCGGVYFAANAEVDLSASEVRRQLARGGGADCVDAGVLAYIREHGLYRGTDGGGGGSGRLQKAICAVLEEAKALDLRPLDVRGMTDITDFMIVAGGRSGRHVKAMAELLQDKLRALHIRPLGVEGEEAAEWVLLDYGDAVVHLMRAEQREFYELERLWGEEVRALVDASRKNA